MKLKEGKIILLAFVILFVSFFANQLNYKMSVSGFVARDFVEKTFDGLNVEESILIGEEEIEIKPYEEENKKVREIPTGEFTDINIGGTKLMIKSIGFKEEIKEEIEKQNLFLEALKGD
ncbi:MAG: hypothetical protein AABY07_06690 [Nanoarchaeota archaeon]